MAIPRVLGADDFSLRRSRSYTTASIDAEARWRVDVLPDRGSDAFTVWLREAPSIGIVCRNRAAGYADAM
ncbi:transposase [Actinomadura madurae]|uniref:transposase n=1 Tax=Actinomadura madurae TaxID=1993 RepID=UPI0011BF9D0D|nr:transposase [Actinomadura madurae]